MMPCLTIVACALVAAGGIVAASARWDVEPGTPWRVRFKVAVITVLAAAAFLFRGRRITSVTIRSKRR